MRNLALALAQFFLVFSSLGVSSQIALADPRIQYEPTNALKLATRPTDSVEVLERRPLRRYVVLGRWWGVGDLSTTPPALLEMARERAAGLGADFVWITKKDMTTHRSGGGGGGGGIGMGSGFSSGAIGLAPLLNATFGVFAKATTGIQYSGPKVVGFAESSAAPPAGVRVDDVILEIDGLALSNERMPERILENSPGQVVKLLIKRGDEKLTIDVPLVAND